jgi:hypothetical protein
MDLIMEGEGMSLFSFLGDAVAKLTGGQTSGEKKKQKEAMNAQIKSYREQTNLANAEIARVKDSEQVEKRRIEEKQIRALRRNYRSQGFLGTSQEEQVGMSQQLGG